VVQLKQRYCVSLAKSDKEKATALQDFFSSVYSVEPNDEFNKLPTSNHYSMSDFTLKEDNILDKLSKLKIDKSPGLYMLHQRVLYETYSMIAYPFSSIFNKSLQLATLPSDWKLAEVTAIYNKGPKSDGGNYRQVCLTSVCCKTLESLICDHVMTYLLDNNLLSDKQYGFIKGRSTMLQLPHMLDKWTEYLENGGQIDVIYSDFEKAFNKVPQKIQSYNLNDMIINWISDILHGRKYRVKS